MRSGNLHRFLGIVAVLLLPATAHAQEATLSGMVFDSTGGVLPGVAVRAVHEASGNSFEAVTDARGAYRLALRVGSYVVTAELAGFAPATRTVSLLVGQAAIVSFQMSVSSVQEAVDVTGEAPLLNLTQSSLRGNIDPRQMQDIPVQGRNWIDLLMLVPGARGNSLSGDNPTVMGIGRSRQGGDFGLNIDGQQVTSLLTAAGDGQPRYSKDAIAEFEFISSRFDASQGRSSGVQVNAITKSGTNRPSGSFSGYFRDDRFNAADHVAKRVLPYQNQQVSATFGGPVQWDRIHFFTYYEYEREPRTASYTTPYAHFNRDLSVKALQKMAGAKVDAQFSDETRLAVRGNLWRLEDPTVGSGSSTPSSAALRVRRSNQVLASLTHLLGNQAVTEVKVGYAEFFSGWQDQLRNPSALFAGTGPTVTLRGVTAGQGPQSPSWSEQETWSVRNDFTYSFYKRGAHTLKLGAEFLDSTALDTRCIPCEGELDASAAAIPVDVSVLFPDLFDVSTWNLAPLSPVTLRWRQAFGSDFTAEVPRQSFAGWLQEDWTVSPRLTLNLGLRYDLELNAFANDVEILPVLPGNRPDDTNNIGPRFGFTFSLNDRTIFRGGAGKYYASAITSYHAHHVSRTALVTVPNDGRPDFAVNPWNGPKPTYDDVKARFCTTSLEPECLRNDFPTGTAIMYGHDFTMPYSYQSSIGLQRQVGSTMAFEADYVYVGTRGMPRAVLLNLSYDPATGANYPFNDLTRRPYSEWGFMKLFYNGSRSNQHALQTGFTKRFGRGWQASGNYTLSVLRDAGPGPRQRGSGGLPEPVPFPVASDFGGDYVLSAGDQRHRAVFNGIWELGRGFQLSGLYFYGSGERLETRYGVDLRGVGTSAGASCECRLRPDGTIAPRNNFVGDSVHRLDLRIQQRIPLGGRATIDGIFEVFNALNHANFGAYNTNEVAANYGQPAQSNQVAYAPRMLQMGFRFAF
jgi:hypothetical protein